MSTLHALRAVRGDLARVGLALRLALRGGRRGEPPDLPVGPDLPPLALVRLVDPADRDRVARRHHVLRIDGQRERAPRRSRVEREERAAHVGDRDRAPRVERRQASQRRRRGQRPEADDGLPARVDADEASLLRAHVHAVEPDEQLADVAGRRQQRLGASEPRVRSPELRAHRVEKPAAHALGHLDHRRRRRGQAVDRRRDRPVPPGHDALARDDAPRPASRARPPRAPLADRLGQRARSVDRHVVRRTQARLAETARGPRPGVPRRRPGAPGAPRDRERDRKAPPEREGPHLAIVAARLWWQVDRAADLSHVVRTLMSHVVAVVGATGAVGREMLRVLEQRSFPVKRLVALASKRSAGQKIAFAGSEVLVEELTPRSFAGVEIALFSAGASVAREMAPPAAAAGAVVIDNSSAWRMDPDCPLVVPEVNMEAAARRPKGIIANPNCSTIQMVVALKPLHDAARLKTIIVSTYQATSGKGHAAVEELLAQARATLDGRTPDAKVFPGTMAFNVLCDWKAGADDYSEEEWKMVYETRKIMGDPGIGVSPTTVRVPVVNGHSEAVHVQFHRPMTAAEAKALLRNAPGVVLMEEPYAPGKHPQPVLASGTDPVYVGRVRDDLAVPGAIQMFVVSDNLRKGAALNAVQIAERVF